MRQCPKCHAALSPYTIWCPWCIIPIRKLFWLACFSLSACAPLPQGQPGYTYSSKFALDVAGGFSPLTGVTASVTPSWTTTATPATQPGIKP